MVDSSHSQRNSAQVSGGKKFLVGTNVAAMVILAVAVVVVAQLIAFQAPLKADMTRTGVNSLTESTERLLGGLPKNIRLTSLYFETDREDEDQPKYRGAIRDLLGLYESMNRGKITAEWVNPLKDHQKYQQLVSRIREKPTYKEGIAAYQARVDEFRNNLSQTIQSTLQAEIQKTAPPAAMDATAPPTALAQVNELLRRLAQELQFSSEQIEGLVSAANPQLDAAVDELRGLYSKLSKALKEIPKFAAAELARSPGLPDADAAVLREAGSRYAELVAALEAETTALGELEPLKVDELLSKLQPTSNAIVLETDDEAAVIDFSSVWPPVDAGMGRASFSKRAFKGEEELTAAIVRATFKQQSAVVFVRYGGEPLFMGGFPPGMPGQPRAPYSAMKKQLEDVNFVVEEWDLKTKDTPPEIKPAPVRTIFVVFKPEPPARDPMGRSSQEPPFGDSQRQALLKAIGENGRAVFVAGWSPGPFGPIASQYEYGEYLKSIWGINVDWQHLLIETVSTKPGQYHVGSQQFHLMHEVEVGNHEIVGGPQAELVALPSCAPLELTSPPPSGVELWPLLTIPATDTIWAINSLQTYREQMEKQGYLSRAEADKLGPFVVAAAGKKGEAKIVVISSRGFAEDDVAFARQPVITSQGFAFVNIAPGNVTLLVNSLHWLNDNMQLLNIGKPIDAAVLTVSPKTVRAVQVFTIGIWPALALALGGVAYWVRRR